MAPKSSHRCGQLEFLLESAEMTVSSVIDSVKRISVFQKFLWVWVMLEWHPEVLIDIGLLEFLLE